MDNKPVILFCINKLGGSAGVGGAERLVVDDINETLSRGYNVHFLTLKKESKFSLGGELRLEKKHWKTIDFGSIFNPIYWLNVYKYIKQENPDIVFSHLWFSNTIIRIVCKIAGVKNIFTFEHNVYDSIKSGRLYLSDRLLQSWSKKIIAVSSVVKESLIKHGIEEKKIVVINNGINIPKYKKEPNQNLRNSLKIPPNSFVFLTIGRLIHQKGMDVLIEAFSKVSQNSILVIVGQGKDELLLKNLANKLGLGDRVCFLGMRHDIPDILATSDVFVLASRYEGQGIVVLEARASGKPIIISDFPAGKDMITTGVNGLVVKREKVEELVNAMEKLKSDSNLRKNLSESAFATVQDFSIQNHINKIMSL